MAYNELIKNFNHIRSYMREFYIFGFKSREEFEGKSARSYDNERRRLESWLGDFMGFRQDSSGKQVFLSVDSRTIPNNPLYEAFKAKSFTRGDLLLHFYLLDLLADGKALSVRELTQRISDDYLLGFDGDYLPDESTVRKKLKEYQQMGLLTCQKQRRELRYQRDTQIVDLSSWQEALAFFSEMAPLGVVGSYLLDRQGETVNYFGFKHHYMLHVLDSEILEALLGCMTEQRFAELTIEQHKKAGARQHNTVPLKIFVSTQTGRQYLLAYSLRFSKLVFFRLDFIQGVKSGKVVEQMGEYQESCTEFMTHLWGVSSNRSARMDHLEMTIVVGKGEEYILQRLEREKRSGTITKLDDQHYLFAIDVVDASEMLPWLRTFIGRIAILTCSKKSVVTTFYRDLEHMNRLYGGDTDGIS